MILPDVNVLVYAHREDAPDHAAYLAWLTNLIESDETYGMADIVLSGFIRVTTHPKVFNPPSTMEQAVAFVHDVCDQPSWVRIRTGVRHWEIFERLCRKAGIKGNLVPDAYLAALAFETGSTWVTIRRDFSRFPDLTWRHPLRL